jgi:4-aminobutyrate aminotransferase-like enzyme/Ser/Thr protein kinase RdoA (MazF antagonist)/murein DD-endopeptidase MepM/ murein hydrolase activator NlpD
MSALTPIAVAGGAVAPEPPGLTAAEAARAAEDLFGVTATASPLAGERDQNFLLRGAGGVAAVLKVAQWGEDIRVLECQNEALQRLNSAGRFRYSRPQRSRGGRLIETVRDATGRTHFVRLFDYIEGVPLATVRRHPPPLLEGVGRLLGATDRALLDFSHPGAHRALHWDLRRASAVVARYGSAIREPARHALVHRFAEQFETYVARLLPALRTGVIHGDGNDWNILVSAVDDPLAEPEAVGLLDLGDIVHSWLVAEPAIGAAYAMLGSADPLAAAAWVVHGYHAELPLDGVEIEALFPLICLRLCTSVVLAAEQRGRYPDNEYLSISEAPAWALLERLASVQPRFAHYVFRAACGLPACPQSTAVTRWLATNAARIGPVLHPDPRTAPAIVLDLGAGSTEFAELGDAADAAAWTGAIRRRMRAAGAVLAFGRYDEARRWYTSDAFRADTDDGAEWRTVHTGIDVFADPGTPVLAPLDGIVHAVRDHAARHDYGPTVMLRHEADGIGFYTLYGHLATDALELRVGDAIRAGDRIGSIGDFPRNGDWAPHLHLQLIVDPLDYDGTFPGVARPSQLAVWRSLSPDPNLLLRVAALQEHGTAALSERQILGMRRAHVAPSLSVSYRRPLHIVRGWMQHLYDAAGQPYLDCVNNVAHVGHCHPHVVDALVRQSHVLNTNTRYLHENLVRYADRLTATLPEPLSVCFLVCSGSEANELALRLARAATGREHFVVLDAAYHGNTGALVGLSPYKFAGAGGAGAPPTTHVVPLPDAYRGPYRGYGRDTGSRYAQHVRDVIAHCAHERQDIAALLVESLPGCAGQIVLPDGFLEEAFAHVRAAGGVCIADEVQVGFGRIGSDFWGFQTQHVVPDIVTVGKPIGNGHPLGAVVTTPEIAAAFANGMEYFNTFGGNPVSCAVGMAVLDVIEAEGLQARAQQVGAQLVAALRALMPLHPLLGDVRGRGLYIGIELVLDRDTLAPAPRHASRIVERMREHGILLAIDGPLHNVIKIKPPLQFCAADAERLARTLERVLAELRPHELRPR